jgi:hypothetical protein
MDTFAEKIVEHVKSHRCYAHPIFANWAKVAPGPEVVGALFHQIQNFCASTRPGLNFPDALKKNGLGDQSALMQEIVESEANHGPELATMAGHIVNRAAGAVVCRNLYDQQGVEAKLKEFSDAILGSLPGYDRDTGLTTQAREAIAVFQRRVLSDRDNTYRNLGTALALEMISNRQLIPGEKHCLIDSGVYKATLNEAEMHYLLEHWGEVGAEQQHEKNAVKAISLITDERSQRLVKEGADDFLNSLTALWDLLDTSLLQSGYVSRLAA